MGESSERVPLVASSPRDRAVRVARPLVVAHLVIAAVVVAALLILPRGTVLTGVMVFGLVGTALVILSFRRFTARRRSLQGTPPVLIAGAYFGILATVEVAGRYLASLLVGPELVSETLFWSLLTAALIAAFLAWAMRPINPRPSRPADDQPLP